MRWWSCQYDLVWLCFLELPWLSLVAFISVVVVVVVEGKERDEVKQSQD